MCRDAVALDPVISSLSDPFASSAGLLVPRSRTIQAVREPPLATASFRSFWHACGTASAP
jgi:hypothetical protein